MQQSLKVTKSEEKEKIRKVKLKKELPAKTETMNCRTNKELANWKCNDSTDKIDPGDKVFLEEIENKQHGDTRDTIRNEKS